MHVDMVVVGIGGRVHGQRDEDGETTQHGIHRASFERARNSTARTTVRSCGVESSRLISDSVS